MRPRGAQRGVRHDLLWSRQRHVQFVIRVRHEIHRACANYGTWRRGARRFGRLAVAMGASS